MVVTAEDDRCAYLAVADGLVECEGDLSAAFAVGIEDAGLRTDDEVVASRLFNPSDVVHHLTLDLFRCLCHYLAEYLGSDRIRLRKVFRFLGHADPSERTEAVVEEERSHDILYI